MTAVRLVWDKPWASLAIDIPDAQALTIAQWNELDRALAALTAALAAVVATDRGRL